MTPYVPLFIVVMGYVAYWALLDHSPQRFGRPFFGHACYADFRRMAWRCFIVGMASIAVIVGVTRASSGNLALPAFTRGSFLAHLRFLLAPAETWARR